MSDVAIVYAVGAVFWFCLTVALWWMSEDGDRRFLAIVALATPLVWPLAAATALVAIVLALVMDATGGKP